MCSCPLCFVGTFLSPQNLNKWILKDWTLGVLKLEVLFCSENLFTTFYNLSRIFKYNLTVLLQIFGWGLEFTQSMSFLTEPNHSPLASCTCMFLFYQSQCLKHMFSILYLKQWWICPETFVTCRSTPRLTTQMARMNWKRSNLIWQHGNQRCRWFHMYLK